MNPQEHLEDTKELESLEELRNEEESPFTIQPDILETMDEVMEDSEEKFENIVQENDEKEKKEEKKKWTEQMKEKWSSFSKKQKIAIIAGIGILVILILVLICFFVLSGKKEEDNTPKVPDVIAEEENYRYENGTLIFLDRNKNELGRYECQNKDQKKCYVAYNSTEDDFDITKPTYENGEKIATRINLYLNQYAFIYDNEEEKEGSITLYDFQKKEKVDEFTLVKTYEKLENYFVGQNKAKEYKIYELKEEGVIPVIDNIYEYIGVFEKEDEEVTSLVTKQNNRWYLTDLAGKNVSSAITHKIKGFNQSVIKVQDAEGYYHLVNYENQEISSNEYDYIDLLEEYAIFIFEQMAYVKDFEGNKMNIDGIELKNTTYLPTAIYNENNRLKETKQSYEISYQGKIMNIRITDGDTVSINLNEGRVSKSLKYLDYFDGKLYFYEDEGKENLLGTYACSSKNSMEEDTQELQNCRVATESYYEDNDIEPDHHREVGAIPIYNKRFVFIKDNASGSDMIKLYDLKENSIKSSYRSIDAGAYTNTQEITFKNDTTAYIIAENLANNNGEITYGIIKLTPDKAEGFVSFDYSHIERIGTRYLLRDASGFMLADQNGKIISDSRTSKIRNYNKDYVVTFNNNKYNIYPLTGEVFDKDSYDYIALYDNYYATISSERLSLYAYKDSEKYDYLKEANLRVSDPKKFDITISGNIATINIDGKSTKVNLTKEVQETSTPEETTTPSTGDDRE